MGITTKPVGLNDGDQVVITGFVPDQFHPGPDTLSFQLETAAGFPIGSPVTFAQDQPLNPSVSPVGLTVFASRFDAVALTDGGFEVAYAVRTEDTNGIERVSLRVVGFDAHGQSQGAGFSVDIDHPNLSASGIVPIPPGLAELPGDRFALAFESFDAQNQPTSHVDLASATGGVYADVVVSSRPDAITHAAGEVTLTWNTSGVAEREVLDLAGNVLASRGVSKILSIGVASNTDLERAGFNPLHDQIRLTNPDGSVAGGDHSTLTYDAGSHILTWDPDSEGPAPATQAAMLVDPKTAGSDGLPFDVANLAEDFRPAVLKVIEASGAQDITWFDVDNNQPWDTLHATFDPQGRLLTYGSTLDDGAGQRFTFDADGSQPWTRYVDTLDVLGKVHERTVLYDDGTSWTAKFTFSGGQVVSYELDNFDTQGHQIGQSFFHADGTPI